MSLPLIIKPAARRDVEDAHDWYEAQRPGRGDEFLVELSAKLYEVKESPDTFGRIWGQVRVAPLARSKFLVYYRIKTDSVTVVAVQHASADPRKWQRRK